MFQESSTSTRTNRVIGSGGFTLIELLVAIAIISLLSTVIMANLNVGRMSARDAARVEAIRQTKLALDIAFDDTKSYPGTNNKWYDMNCDPLEPSPDATPYADFSTIFGAPYMAETPRPIGNTCIWYRNKNSGAGYIIAFQPELTKTLSIDQDCYISVSWYCTGVNYQ